MALAMPTTHAPASISGGQGAGLPGLDDKAPGAPGGDRRRVGESGPGAQLRIVRDDLLAMSDGLPAKPGLGFDRIAAAFVRLLDGAVAGARDREVRDDSLITVGIYGPWGSGKSTLMRAVH
jgi:hypothetical protein